MLFLAMMVFAPVAKNCHVAFHSADANITGEMIDEECALCSLEFPAFEEIDNSLAVNVIEREYSVFVPSIIGNLCNSKVNSKVIRGPPEA